LAARGLHRQSRRAGGPFIAINCAAIPGSLAEAELFGVERGAFTDAREARPGVFEQAHGGTLFLDEVGDMSPGVQAKLLRVLEHREVTRLGGQRARHVNVRIVAATNRDLRQTEQFRSDILFRLQGFPIRLPPLRERPGDLPILIAHVLNRVNAELHTQVAAVSPRLQAWIAAHPFPGNVRELENLLRYGALLCDGPVLDVAHYPNLNEWRAPGPAPEPDDGVPDRLATLVARATADVERTAIEAALHQHHGKRSQVARTLGMGRRTLFKKMQQYGLAAADSTDHADD
jgi:DNA-binding NtrC family response regulator